MQDPCPRILRATNCFADVYDGPSFHPNIFSTEPTNSALTSLSLENMAGQRADAIRPGDLRLDCAKTCQNDCVERIGPWLGINIIMINQRNTWRWTPKNNHRSFMIHWKMEFLLAVSPKGLHTLFEPSPTKHCKFSRSRCLQEFLSEHAWNSSHLGMKKKERHIRHLVLKHDDSKKFQFSIRSSHSNHNCNSLSIGMLSYQRVYTSAAICLSGLELGLHILDLDDVHTVVNISSFSSFILATLIVRDWCPMPLQMSIAWYRLVSQ